MEGKILDIVIENSNRRLDQVTFMNDEYKQLQRKLNKKLKRADKLKLTEKERKDLDRLLVAHNEKSSCCCRILYRQGYIDCIHLLKEIGILPGMKH